MSHHGSNPFDANRSAFMKSLLDTASFRGAIGEHPHGKLTASDEGSIQLAVGEKDGKVVIDFGTPVHWLGMTPQQAADFASTILKRARAVALKNGEMVGFTIA